MAKPRILVADDEEGIRESIKLILSNLYDLAFTTDGEQTLKRLRTESFEVVLLDIKMPKLDGMEVLRKAKSEGITTPIILLTAYQSVELAREAVKLGAADYLPKPFERDQVLNAIRDVLAST